MRRPFISTPHTLKDNRMLHGWSNLVTLLPRGAGLCLDLGAGDGRHRMPIEQAGWMWIGMDIVDCPNLVMIADAQQLPLVANSIDLVFTNQVLEHLPRPRLAVSEAFRTLKPGGQLVGSVAFLEPFHDSYYGFSHWAIEQLLQDHGFQLLELRPGATAFVTIAKSMLPDMSLGSLIGKWLGRVSMGLLRVVGGFYMVIRFGRGSHQWQQYQDFWVKAPLRFAGHIMFAARKPDL